MTIVSPWFGTLLPNQGSEKETSHLMLLLTDTFENFLESNLSTVKGTNSVIYVLKSKENEMPTALWRGSLWHG